MNKPAHEPDEERDCGRSGVVFGVFGSLCLLMLAAPGMMFRSWGGALILLVGLLMAWLPPLYRLGRWQWGLAIGFLGCAGLGLLPVGLVRVPEWREALISLGLPETGKITLQPLWTWQSLGAMAVTVVGALYLQGHRTDHGAQHRLVSWFAGGVAVLALVAVAAQQGEWNVPWDLNAAFGFFPNRNHFGTLLAMGALAGLGVAVQSLRIGRWFAGTVALICVGFLLTVIVGRLGSRAAVLLVAGGFGTWIMLMGGKYLGARLLTVVAMLAVVAVLYFQSADSEARNRMIDTIRRAELVAGGGDEAPASESGGGEWEDEDATGVDARISIQKDALGIIRDFPLTGVGAGQFAAVFPLYRKATVFQADARSVHPESDWLLVAGECGIPAVLCLAGLVAVVGWGGLRASRRGHARAMRTGCLVAALVLPVHGFGDVPLHHVALVWVAAWLVATGLRGGRELVRAGRVETAIFRVLGVAVMAAGGLVIGADRTGAPPLARAMEANTAAEVGVLFREDLRRQAEARAAGKSILDEPGADDLLEAAKTKVVDALRVTPMSAHLQGLSGIVQMQFDDTEEYVERAFALQRALDPMGVKLLLDQGIAWSPYFPERVPDCWGEALRRAEVIDRSQSGTLLGVVPVFAKMLVTVRKHPWVAGSLVETGRRHPEVIGKWASEVGPQRVDGAMAGLASMVKEEPAREWVMSVWRQYGSKGPPQPKAAGR